MNETLNLAIDEAFVYAYPLYEVARTRYADALGAGGLPGLPSNKVLHDPRVCDHLSRWVTTPNNDTLYSRAWIDLTTGPVRIEIDTLPENRYWSVAFMDAWTNNFVIIGQHSEGIGPVRLTLFGPETEHLASAPGEAGGPAGRVIRAPGNDVWMFARWLVDPEGDPAIGQRMQTALHLGASGPGRPIRSMPTGEMDAANFVAVVCERMAFNPPPVADAAVLARISQAGLRPSVTDPWPNFPESLRQAWCARLEFAQARLRESVQRDRKLVQGWWVRDGAMGDFGTAYGVRAAVALAGLAALPPDEAVYAGRTHDDDGSALDGRNAYCLTVPAQGIPAQAFWSLSMYEPSTDGRRFFADNPIRRYTIGDRTPGLRYEADGSLFIWISHKRPSDDARASNWLPAPAGTFVLTLRAYRPRPELRSWQARLPGLKCLK